MHLALAASGSHERILEVLASAFLSASEMGSLKVECYLTSGNSNFLGSWLDRVSVLVLEKSRQRAANRMRDSRRRYHDVLWVMEQLAEEGTEGVMVCHPSVSFVEGWDAQTCKMVISSEDYLATRSFDTSRYAIALSLDEFSRHAAECVYFSAGVVDEIARDMRLDFESRCPPFERWLAEWCMASEVPLLCGVPSVARVVRDVEETVSEEPESRSASA